jgi:hypothetical protein
VNALDATSPDPLARAGAIAIGIARIGVGITALAATRPALKTIGLGDDEGAVVLARIAGIRDVALGLHALSVRNDGPALAQASWLAALADAGDAATFAALATRRGLDRAVVMNFPAATGAAAAGAWVGARLRS